MDPHRIAPFTRKGAHKALKFNHVIGEWHSSIIVLANQKPPNENQEIVVMEALMYIIV